MHRVDPWRSTATLASASGAGAQPSDECSRADDEAPDRGRTTWTLISCARRDDPVSPKPSAGRRVCDVDDLLTRFWSELVGRVHGPFSFRFLLQPLMAMLYATRDGIVDARQG